MLTNKPLDDNTYTSKSWSKVSGIDFTDLNKMVIEFLEVFDHNLYVCAQEFAVWKILFVSCRDRHPVRCSDPVQEGQKGIYNTLYMLGLYDNQFDQYFIQTAPKTLSACQKKKDFDHIVRIVSVLDKSFKRDHAYVKKQQHERKVQALWEDPWGEQQNQTCRPFYQSQSQNGPEGFLAPNQMPIILQPTGIFYEEYTTFPLELDTLEKEKFN